MPHIDAYIFKGYDAGTRTRLSHGLTDALRMVIPAPPTAVTVLLHEMERENFMRGGALRRPVEANSDPRDMLRRFHTAMMAGDFTLADTLITDDCVFRMPGGDTVSRPHELASVTASHWKEFSMAAQGVEICPGPEGPVVYERGVFNGVAANGAIIENLRSVTRVEFRGPLICDFEFMSNRPLFPPEGT